MKKKSLLFVFLYFVLIFIVVIMIKNFDKSHAAGTVVTSGTSGTVTWTLYSDGELILKPTSGTTGTLADTGQNGPWYDETNLWHEQITKVTVQNTVKTGANARGLFANCHNITEMNLTGLNTSSTTNFSYMFYNSCDNLQVLDLSMFNTANGTTFREMFEYCYAKEINLRNFNTKNANMVDMGMRFIFQHTSITKITIGANFDFHITGAIAGHPFGRGTWVRASDGKRFSAADIAYKSSTQSMAGTYTKISGVTQEMTIDYPVTYKIQIKQANFTDFTTTNSDFVVVDSNNVFISHITNPNTADYTVPGQFSFVITDGAVDEAGTKYDFKVTVSNIHLYDLDTATYNNAGNLYWQVAYVINGSISFAARGYDRLGSTRTQITSNAAKYSVKYEVLNKSGNAVSGTYVFSAYDLDTGSTRDYATGIPSVTSNNRGYGTYSEGVNLKSGYTANTIKLYPTSYMRNEAISGGRRLYGTHSDEASELTEFSVKANANAFNFEWTGEYCTTNTLTYYQPTTINILKQKDSGGGLAGASLSLYYAGTNGALIESWTSTTSNKSFFLSPGEYILKETAAPYGYNTASDIDFYIDIDGKLRDSDGNTISRVTMTNIEIEKRTYTVNYLDIKTNEAIQTAKTGSAHYLGDVIQTNDEIIQITGYKYIQADKNSLTISTGTNVINLYYARDKVTTKYVDIDTNQEIAAQDIQYGPEDDPYTTTQLNITGYRFYSDTGNTSGTFTRQDIEVIYYYRLIQACINLETITFDENNNEITLDTEDIVYVLKDSNNQVVKTFNETNGFQVTLLPGTYTLYLNVAPDGFYINVPSYGITVDSNGYVILTDNDNMLIESHGLDVCNDLYVVLHPINLLPNTGGEGILKTVLIGFTVGFIAWLGIAINSVRKKGVKT